MNKNKEKKTWDYVSALEQKSSINIKERCNLFIGGKFVKPSSGKYFDTINPATEERVSKIAYGNNIDIDLAVKSARNAYLNTWSKVSPSEKSKYIYRIARLMQERARELAIIETLDSGKVIRESRDIDIPLAYNHFFYYETNFLKR